MDDEGTTHTESTDVINEFMGFYQRPLGGERRSRFLDLRFLRPWSRYIITEEDSNAFLMPVTASEVKMVFFDIAEDKSPGLDGFSSGFYKAAWPVVGEEVTSAILEFFNTGKLLKQVNATLLALIPKVHPSLVADFRPISCCNVLYKAITKIIVQRLSIVLDQIISPSQNAFVPGRSIGDNILLAQELFTGYNVDLRKAYDTVEWEFLLIVLRLFGFPDPFVHLRKGLLAQVIPEIEKTAQRLRWETKQQTKEASTSYEDGKDITLEFEESSGESEEVMAIIPERSIKDMTSPDLYQQPLCIEYPDLEVNFELKFGLIHLLRTFRGLAGEDPHKHLKEFHVVCSAVKQRKEPFAVLNSNI
ncbi:UNVERIFIED_CONTAM: hypothetical protein Slati_1776600 [Sesamum latifolium]|uniref:Reverse transcriptase domain-containing protein n=1 Tax=Sesamum latifolium TaxID=2727402 RepID=A0AAW2WX57_9LAMI